MKSGLEEARQLMVPCVRFPFMKFQFFFPGIFFGRNEFNYGVKSAQPFSQIITGKRQAFSIRVGHIRKKLDRVPVSVSEWLLGSFVLILIQYLSNSTNFQKY